ncbi:MAG: NAD(P)-dependent oxidoreductase, partial [Verrucomicrobiota bacterium JB024]|nr:NAD(P)-dependent oxidoreductase [Verrucomicrobiota bacterium JB024]
MPAKVYTDKDADLKVLKGKTLAVIGYGSQGHAHALNLKDSGCKVIIGLYPKSKSVAVAKKQGFEVFDTAEAVKRADVIMLSIPDMVQPEVYEKDVLPNLTKGKTLVFCHGLCVHFGLITPPKGVDVIMVAPKGPGHVVRSQYVEGLIRAFATVGGWTMASRILGFARDVTIAAALGSGPVAQA